MVRPPSLKFFALVRRWGAVVDGKLYLIAFEAPTLHHFDRDVAAYRALAASARLGVATK